MKTFQALAGPYRYLLASAGVASLGDGIRFTALPLLAAALLADPVQVAAVTAATTLPWLLFGLLVGAYADRVDRVRMMVWADVLRAGALMVAVLMLVTGQLSLLPLLALAFLLGVGEVMFDCASFAVVPSLVPPERLEAANGYLFATRVVGRDLLGHLLGAVLYTVTRWLPLAANALSFAVSALVLNRLPPQRITRPDSALLRDVLEGVRYLVTDRLLAALTAAGGVMNALFLGQVAILVLLVRDVLGLDATGYAMVLVVGAIGSVIGSLLAQWLVAQLGRSATLVIGFACFGLAGVGASIGTIVTTLAGYLAMGFGLMIANIVAVSLRQSLVPPELRGRTFGAYRLVSWGTMPLGALLFGVMADSWGIRPAFAVGGAGALLVAALLIPVLAGDGRLSRAGQPQSRSTDDH